MGVVGIDVGGTSIKGGVIDAGRTLLTRRVANPRHEGPEAVVETILAAVGDLVGGAVGQGCDIDAVGVASLGVVDEHEGIARWSSAVQWRDVPLQALVAERVGAPVVVGHDVRAAAVAEATMGAGRGHRHVLFLPLGTSLSVAQVIDGQAVAGATWRAGEIGQLPASGRSIRRQSGPGDRSQPSDRPALERVASAQALAERFAQAAGRLPGSTGSAGRVASAGAAGAGAVIEAAAEGDVAARRVLDDALGHLTEALAAVITFADPSVVIVGGGLSLAGEALLAPLRAQVADALTWREPPPLAKARFGDQAGWIGAALFAWRHAGHPDDRFPYRPSQVVDRP